MDWPAFVHFLSLKCTVQRIAFCFVLGDSEWRMEHGPYSNKCIVRIHEQWLTIYNFWAEELKRNWKSLIKQISEFQSWIISMAENVSCFSVTLFWYYSRWKKRSVMFPKIFHVLCVTINNEHNKRCLNLIWATENEWKFMKRDLNL